MGKQDSKIVPQLNARVYKTGALEYTESPIKRRCNSFNYSNLLNIDEIDPKSLSAVFGAPVTQPVETA